MILETIKLTHFKNYRTATVHCSPKLNCFVGLNGMGKTNLLDAIYYLCMGRSHFRQNDRNIVLHEEQFFRLEGHFKRKKKKEKIVAKVIPGQKKSLERNEVLYPKISEHLGFLPVVMISPDDTQLATEGSEERRRFLDHSLSQIDREYLHALLTHNKILKQRNAALKQMGQAGVFNPELIQAYDKQILSPAQLIFEKRKAFVKNFEPDFDSFYRKISGNREHIKIEYQSQLAKQSYEELLRESIEKDKVLQRTTKGIHKDEINILLNGHPLKRFGSQGQLKSFVLALKLAQYLILQKEKEIDPLLLLDDIFDKLDGQRVRFLLKLLDEKNFGQIFISDTHKDRVEVIFLEMDIPFRIFEVADGQIINEF